MVRLLHTLKLAESCRKVDAFTMPTIAARVWVEFEGDDLRTPFWTVCSHQLRSFKANKLELRQRRQSAIS
jgi:hypothetical protein